MSRPPEAVHQMLDANYWRSAFPGLVISDKLDPSRSKQHSSLAADGLGRFDRDGAVVVRHAIDKDSCTALLDGIDRSVSTFGHPIYSLILDSFWAVLFGLPDMLAPIVRESLVATSLPAVIIVPPRHVGVRPHRDALTPAFDVSGNVARLSIWYALTDAGPDRACLSFVPLCFDSNVPDNLSEIDVDDVRLVRAVPMSAGDALIFNQAVLHWGGFNATTSTRVGVVCEVAAAATLADDPVAVSLTDELSFDSRLSFLVRSIIRLADNDQELRGKDLELALAVERKLGQG